MKLKLFPIVVHLLIFGLFATSCDILNNRSGGDPADLHDQKEMHGLLMELTLEPNQMHYYGQITARYSILNTRAESVEMTSGCTQPARGVVFKNNQEAGLHGSASGCYTAISHYKIAPGEKLELEWEIHPFSVRVFHDNQPPDTTFADKGDYLFTVMPDIIELNGKKTMLPELEKTFFIE